MKSDMNLNPFDGTSITEMNLRTDMGIIDEKK